MGLLYVKMGRISFLLLTVFDAEPIRLQDDIFVNLSKAHYFSKLDLSKGYWQVPLTESAKPLTAFITHDGLYQFRTMPFGLVNAPATFSRIMCKLLFGLEHAANYIDDILIYTETWDEHIIRLRELFFVDSKGVNCQILLVSNFIFFISLHFLR